MRRLAFLLTASICATAAASAQNPNSATPSKLPGLAAAAEVARDVHGIAHIRAGNPRDLFFMQGYVHAQDRLFQMDISRRRASGTLAELLGPAALASDVQLRTIGIRRAAERSLAAISPEAIAALEAYAAGVNAYVARHPLPPEYAALEITTFAPWTALDALAVAKSITFSLSFDLGDIDNTVALSTYAAILGNVGQAFLLFSQDLWRSQPFFPASTVPDATAVATTAFAATVSRAPAVPSLTGPDPAVAALARQYLEKVRDLPDFQRWLDRDNRPGSNQWAISERHTVSGAPLVANDPHLALGMPSTFYPVHLRAGALDVMGSGFAGVPFVIVGQNRHIAWGATVNPLDTTDVFHEQLVPDATSPSGLSSIHKGALEHVIPIPESYRANQPGNGTPNDLITIPPGGGIPAATLIVPRRNNGPILQFDPASGAALSVQYTGFSGTREVDTFLIWSTARGLDDFMRGLQYFDSGSQNFAYGDIAGNIAYLTSSEVPVREDLQAGVVTGSTPWLIRSGQGGNEWLPVEHPQPGQAVPFEILPFDEMPHVINPPAGWFVNANNDPAGTVLDNNPLNQARPGGGIFYLNAAYDTGFRAARITALVRQKLEDGGKVSFGDMQEIQADTMLLDSQYFVPHIVNAWRRAKTPGADPVLAAFAADGRVGEAVQRLEAWSGWSPTGIPEGFDAADIDGVLSGPTSEEVAASIATTIYSVWRGQFIRRVVDAPLGPAPKPPSQLALTALKSLFDHFAVNQGRGFSGVDFFIVPGVVAAEDRRDVLILSSLVAALDRLAGPEFTPAFGGSADQHDYLWGRLHRIVFSHPLGGPFSVPPAFGAFPAPLAGLPGIPVDGGLGAVDASNHEARAQAANDFMFANGPVNRFVAEAGMPGVQAESVWPGGTSGVPLTPFYLNLLPLWLTNDTIPLLYRQGDLQRNLDHLSKFTPAR